MSDWLRRFFKSRPSHEALLNEGLELAMNWGESWLSPIQERLHQQHPHLRAEELDEINTTCQAAMKFGHEVGYELVREKGREADLDLFASRVLARHSWISPENAARLFKQSMYYAWKAGGPARNL